MTNRHSSLTCHAAAATRPLLGHRQSARRNLRDLRQLPPSL